MPTVNDVAKRAGVSPITVSRVINNSGYISDVTRERVETAIKEIGYVPNTLARGLRSKRTNTLALVVTDITNPYFTSMARGVEDVAGDSNYTVIYCNTDESETKEEKYANMLAQRQVDGVLLVPACGNAKIINFLESNNISVVVLDRRVSGVNTDFVRSDSENGAYRLIKLLIGLGHEQIAVITGPKKVSTAVDRVKGYRQALVEAGLSENELIYYGSFTQQSGYDFTKQAMLQSSRPTAIFAANNFILLGVVKALRELQLNVPDDVSVVGFDNIPQSAMINPSLTTVQQPLEQMGRVATQMLLGILKTPKKDVNRIELPTELIIRSSTSVPKNGTG